MSTVIVALIPNGLVLSIALAYALGAVRMLGKGMLIQQGNAVESLSNVDVLCTDKTGTLTSNVIRVHDAAAARARPQQELERLLGVYAATTTDVNRTAAALQDAYPAEAVRGRRRGALLVAAQVERPGVRRRRTTGPTSSAPRGAGAGADGRGWAADRATRPTSPRERRAADARRRAESTRRRGRRPDWRAQAEAWAEQGLRVLLFAGRPEALAFGEPSRPPLPAGLAPLGLVCLSDELRPHVQRDAGRVRRGRHRPQDHLRRQTPHTVASLAAAGGAALEPAGAASATTSTAVSGAELDGRWTATPSPTPPSRPPSSAA